MQGRTTIPDLRPGDPVWWHCDLIHGVAPVEDQRGWGNVMYIPAAPMCDKNAEYAVKVAQRFAAGESPDDFPTSTTKPTGPAASPKPNSTTTDAARCASNRDRQPPEIPAQCEGDC